MKALLVILLILFIGAVLLFGIYLLTRYVGIKKLSYRRYFTQSGVFEGESVYLVEEICNAFFLPLFFIDVEAYIYANLSLDPETTSSDQLMQSFCSRFFLMPFTRVQRKHPVQCVGRGYYRLESVHIYFARNIINLDAPAEIYVYPHMLLVEESTAMNQEIQNNCYTIHNLVRDPFSLSGLREYHRGDSFASINFKATAKTGTLKVNERDPLSNRNFMIYINYQNETKETYLNAREYEKLMEKALSYSAYLIHQAIDNGYKTGFSANANTVDGDWLIRITRSSGSTHYMEILKAMAKIKNSVGISFVSLLERDMADNMTGSEVYLFTLYLDQRIRDAADNLRKLGNNVTIQPLLPSEEKYEIQ